MRRIESWVLLLCAFSSLAAPSEGRVVQGFSTASYIQPLKHLETIANLLLQGDIKAPAYIRKAEPGSPLIRSVPLPLPLSAVRVVYPLADSDEEGASKYDTIIESFVTGPDPKNRRKTARFIANSDRATGKLIQVPKLAEYQEKPPEKKDEEADTLRVETEDETWTPTLLRAPMPGKVIDELRNKYGKHRTRHEPDYQRALENRERRKAEWKAWAKSGGGMLSSPVKEAAAKERFERRQKGREGLTEEILERIGGLMAGKGIEFSEARRKEMERNLEKEGVVGGVGGMDGPGGPQPVRRAKAEKSIVVDEEAEVEEEKERLEEMMDRMGIDEIVINEAEGEERDRGRDSRV